MKFRPAKQVREIASKLIGAHHGRLFQVPILFLSTDEAETVHGKPALANHHKVGGRELLFLAYGMGNDALRGATTGPLDAFATDPNGDVFEDPEGCFLITVFASTWAMMTDKQKEACIDHELCHCEIRQTNEGNKKRVTRPHDVEEFNEIVQRHGAWMSNVEQFIKDATVGQTSMELGDEDEEEAAETPKPKRGRKA